MSNQMLNEKVNLLINERNPQMQDEDKPSDWHSWETSAFKKEENRSMFLNINYVACNWCNFK